MIVNWVDAIEKIPADHFVGVNSADDLPDPPKSESMSWAGHFFLPGMGPYDLTVKPRHSYVCNHEDIDLLRHEIGLPNHEPVTIYEGRNFFISRFTLSQRTDAPAAVQKKAAQLLNMQGEGYNWKFRGNQTLGNDILLSTNKDLSIMFIQDWTGRADAVIRKDHLYIVTYKKRPSVTGLLNDYQWFPEKLRH